MPSYALSPIFECQFIATGAAAPFTFAPPGGGTVVPPNVFYQISSIRVINKGAPPTLLTMWRVPNGGGTTDVNLCVPELIVPSPTQSFPWFDVTSLWGAILRPGDSIAGLAGTGAQLIVIADGSVITP